MPFIPSSGLSIDTLTSTVMLPPCPCPIPLFGCWESLPAANTGREFPSSPIPKVSKMLIVHPWPLILASPCTVFPSAGCLKTACEDPVPASWCYTVCLSPSALLKRLLQTQNLWPRFRRDIFSSWRRSTFTNVNLSQWPLETKWHYHGALCRYEHFKISIWPQ